MRQRGGRLLLPGERTVQVDLEDVRELGVHRRHRPRHRVLDDLPRLRRRNGERLGQRRVVVERRPSGELADAAGALEHLFRPGEVLDHRPRRLGVTAVRVDRELRAAERGRGPPAWRGGHHRHRIAAGDTRGRAVLHQ